MPVFSSKNLDLAPLNLRFFPRIGYNADYSHFVSQKPTQENAQIYLKIASKARSQTGSYFISHDILENIYTDIERLEESAFIGAKLDRSVFLDSSCRYLVTNNYLVFYIADGKTVYVERIFHSKEDFICALFG